MPSKSNKNPKIVTTIQPRAYEKNNRVFLHAGSRSVSNPVMVGNSFFPSHAAVIKHLGTRVTDLKASGAKLFGSYTVREATLDDVKAHVPNVQILESTEVDAMFSRVAAKDADVSIVNARKRFDGVVWRDGGVTIQHHNGAVPTQHFTSTGDIPAGLKAVTEFTIIGL